MIEIKFRGKREDNGEWIYGSLLTPVGIMDIYEISDCNTVDGSRYEIERNTIGQYTGLKDKNGKEIYEGDIVKANWFDKEEIIGKIAFGLGCFMLCDSKVSDNQLFIFKNLEVIGNIYDNPDLIKE